MSSLGGERVAEFTYPSIDLIWRNKFIEPHSSYQNTPATTTAIGTFNMGVAKRTRKFGAVSFLIFFGFLQTLR